MNVSEAVDRRISARAFLDEPVPREVLERVLTRAARSPSGGNLQPWLITVLDGEKLQELLGQVAQKLEGEGPDTMEYDVYPPNLHEPYRSRRFGVGESMYDLLGIERADKARRLQWFARNYRFFGAPAALFVHVDRKMGAPQWSDLGMYLQTAMLLFQEEGYDTCAQEAWGRFYTTVDKFVGADPQTMLFCGMAIGKIDPEHPVNKLRAERAPTEEWLRFM